MTMTGRNWLSNIFIAILWIVICVMCYITTSRDCREVREIKELMGEK